MPGDKRTTVTRLRVLTIRPHDVKATSYRIEMKLAEPRVAIVPYVHPRRR